MMMLSSELSLSLDSALCCLALGASAPRSGTRLGFALLFGLCDLTASLLASLPISPIVSMPPAFLYPVLVVLLGVGARSYPRLAWAAPVVLSLDNLASASSVPDAFVDGASSALFALIALQAGAWLARRGAVRLTLVRGRA
jgi:hypothetical protein